MIVDKTCWSKLTPNAAMQIVSNSFAKIIAQTPTYRIVECDNCFIKTIYTAATLAYDSELEYFKQDK